MWLRREISPWSAKKVPIVGKSMTKNIPKCGMSFGVSDSFSETSEIFSETSEIFSETSEIFSETWDIFSETWDFFLETWDFFLETWDVFLETWDVFLESYGMVRKRSLKFVWGCTVGERRCVTNYEYRHSFSPQSRDHTRV